MYTGQTLSSRLPLLRKGEDTALFPLLWPLLLRSTGSGRADSAAMAHGPSRSATWGILPDRCTNPRPPHRQADSQPLRHPGSPPLPSLNYLLSLCINKMCPEHCQHFYFFHLPPIWGQLGYLLTLFTQHTGHLTHTAQRAVARWGACGT